MLAALGFAVPLEGGRLTLTATQSRVAVGAPVPGTAELTDFTMRDAPAATKLLQALTRYGLFEALSGPGLGFTRATLPFRFDDGVLSLEGARAYSASLGLTATGRIDLRQRELDLKGTVVPAYVFNALLGNLPLIGRLFSTEKGGGLFSAGFEVKGPLGDPRVSVNPLSALTPGFLHGLFDLGGKEAASTGVEAAALADADERCRLSVAARAGGVAVPPRREAGGRHGSAGRHQLAVDLVEAAQLLPALGLALGHALPAHEILRAVTRRLLALPGLARAVARIGRSLRRNGSVADEEAEEQCDAAPAWLRPRARGRLV